MAGSQSLGSPFKDFSLIVLTKFCVRMRAMNGTCSLWNSSSASKICVRYFEYPFAVTCSRMSEWVVMSFQIRPDTEIGGLERGSFTVFLDTLDSASSFNRLPVSSWESLQVVLGFSSGASCSLISFRMIFRAVRNFRGLFPLRSHFSFRRWRAL